LEFVMCIATALTQRTRDVTSRIQGHTHRNSSGYNTVPARAAT